LKLLRHIEDKPVPKDIKCGDRAASRAVLFDEENLIPMLFVGKYKYHKLPGGGIEKGEDEIIALHREIKEEAGCKAEILGEVGKVTEFRSEWNLYQTSYCWWGKVTEKGTQDFTKKEKEQGFKLVWLGLDDAIKAVKNDKPENYEGKFIQERDLALLEEVEKIIT